MRHHLLTVVGAVTMLVLLLVVLVEPVSAISPLVESADQPSDVPWSLLVVVGGVVLLASVIWLRKLRRLAP